MPTRNGGQKGFHAQQPHGILLGFTREAPEGFLEAETLRKRATKERRRCWVSKQHQMERILSVFTPVSARP